MRAAGEIVLVSCYESGHQPLGVASPMAFLRRAGFDPVAVDLAVDGEGAGETLARAKLVAISMPMHTALRIGARVVGRAKELNPAAVVCCYGLYAPLHREHLLAVGADAVLAGEPERELVDLAVKLSEPHGMSPPAPSEAEGVPLNRRLQLIAPSRDGLPPLDRYARLVVGGERRLAGYVEATRGCKHLCRHCPIPAVYHGRFTAVPLDVVLADASAQIAAGARHITFGDADFLNGPRHAVAVARALHAAHPAVTWDATIKVEHILAHLDLLPEFVSLGCVFVVSAFESLSDRVLALLDKGHTAADAVTALRAARAAGISLRPTFVPFTPWTTLDDYRALCAFLVEHDLLDEVDPVQLSLRLLVPPGSLLLTHPEAAAAFGPLDPEGATHVWTHPDPRVDRLATQVAALVEEAAPDVYARIFALAGAPSPRAPSHRPPPPRLSEPWFC